MSQYQPQHDPRRQRPATPPQWQQPGAPPAGAGRGSGQQDPWAASAQPGWQQQPPQGYYPPQPPPAPVKPKGNAAKGCAFLGCGGLAAVVILVAVLTSHGGGSGSSAAPAASSGVQQPAALPADSAPQSSAAPQTVTYEVTGSSADVTYGPAGSDYSGSVPMHVTKPLGTPVYYAISAQLQGGGTVSCKILVDGKAVSSSTATGGYNIAQCEISQDPLSGNWQDTNG